MSLNRIYDNGYLAGEAGVNPCLNPHLPGTKEHDAWANGFDDAVRELEQRVIVLDVGMTSCCLCYLWCSSHSFVYWVWVPMSLLIGSGVYYGR